MENNYLFGFKSKKERDDFLIALAVILFFGWLLFKFGLSQAGFGDSTVYDNPIASTAVLAADDEATADIDGDGVYDIDDSCPELAGTKENKGCPADTDGDGVYDEADKCPELAGDNDGCPPDPDRDGVYGSADKCPDLAGTARDRGCPPDADKDGVYDADDKCPHMSGSAENNGCPEVKVDEAEAKLLKEAMQAVEFQTGSANLKSTSKGILEEIAVIMKKYPNYKLDILGHTDNVGKKEANLLLSINRAKSCYQYMVDRGIAEYRLNYKGFGQSRPIEDNAQEEGRSKNRRVEFKLHY